MTRNKNFYEIWGKKEGMRLDTRLLEEMIQKAVERGYRDLKIQAYGQHGIGGRLWRAGSDPVHICVNGYPGQRVGSMGYPNTFIDVKGPASDDVGWLNAGAKILIRGNASNGVANAMAQGKIFVKGNIGSRGMTMTKHNPRFEPPELWVLGSAGDYFGEFMAGGIAVICGHEPQNPDNVLGYRPLVGMVGGKVFFRGPHQGYSQSDAKLTPIKDEDWKWLKANIKIFLGHIEQEDLVKKFSQRDEWQLLIARMPHERISQSKRSMQAFHRQVWDKSLGKGGMVGDLTDLDRSVIPVITRSHLRRFVPVWENRKFSAPCEATCPTGIPVQERWRLVREGRIDEAVDLALAYTPFPATVCGYLCPNPCMQACTKQSAFLTPVDVTQLGKASIKAKEPELPPFSGRKVAIIGGGPAGLSIAWQLRNQGHKAVIYDSSKKLGGKIASVIPHSRIPKDIFNTEMERIKKVVEHVHLKQKLTREEIIQLTVDYDFVIIAIGADKPRTLPLPGGERIITALDFLSKAKADNIEVGKRVVVIGAGNAGCDVATEAHRLGAAKVTLLDVQKPASFGKEREHAEAIGAEFRWPVFTKEVTDQGVVLEDGEVIPADNVFISIGDAPDLDFLPEDVAIKHGFVVVDENYQTTNPKIFAVGDVVRPGLLTDAIGAGRKTALAVGDILAGKRPGISTKTVIDIQRISLEYLDPRLVEYEDLDHCGAQCSSCGACRDCGICVAICPESAIGRIENKSGQYEYQVDEKRCIACGFCAGACPCGIWDLIPNTPLE
jgi:NADPH-dependent glutamate synthase beta subunit-like oxidoreductase/glutamate synthase domain-containing protein 3/NAD-dependent dihydropyrimidine dehydrogenase PreA subunit